MQAEGKSDAFVDCLAIDLATARLLYSPMPDVVERVRSELVAIRDMLIQAFPDSAIVLTGSLSVGEGQVEFVSGHPIIRSDCDLFVVSRNVGHLWPPAAHRRLAATLDVIPLSTHLDISLVWEPMLRKRMTTISGSVIGGTLEISEILTAMPAPPSDSALLRAYGFFTAAPLSQERYEYLCAKSLMLGAQALLLHKVKDRPRREWIRLSSLVFIRDAIQGAEMQIGADAVDAIRRASYTILGDESGGFSANDHLHYAAILGSIADLIPLPSSRKMAIKHALWLLREKRWGIPCQSISAANLRGLRIIAESWRLGQFDYDGVRKAEQLAESLYHVRPVDINADPMAAYVSVRELFASLAGFNPHKLYYGPRGVSI